MTKWRGDKMAKVTIDKKTLLGDGVQVEMVCNRSVPEPGEVIASEAGCRCRDGATGAVVRIKADNTNGIRFVKHDNGVEIVAKGSNYAKALVFVLEKAVDVLERQMDNGGNVIKDLCFDDEHGDFSKIGSKSAPIEMITQKPG